jgi:hypothetical protein
MVAPYRPVPTCPGRRIAFGSVDDRILIETTDDRTPSPRRGVPRFGLVVVAVLAAAGLFAAASGGPAGDEATLDAPIEPFRPPSGSWVERTFGGDGAFTDAAAGPAGLVAVGTGRRLDSPPFAWFTDDGRVWTPGRGPWTAGAVVRAVVPVPDGFLAAGSVPADEGRYEDAVPAVWHSPDGVVWEEVAADGLPGRGVITDLSVTGSTVTAIGWEGPAVLEPVDPPDADSPGRVWQSDDGARWVDRTPAGERLMFGDVDSRPDVTVVGGSRAGQPIVWEDRGNGWSQVAVSWQTDPPRSVVALELLEEGVLAVVRPLSELEGIPEVVRIGTDGSVESLGDDGRPTGVGWIAAGERGIFAGAPFTRSRFVTGPELWVSAAGEDWQGLEVTRGRSPWPPALVTEVAAVGPSTIALGARGGSPVVWVLDGT